MRAHDCCCLSKSFALRPIFPSFRHPTPPPLPSGPLPRNACPYADSVSLPARFTSLGLDTLHLIPLPHIDAARRGFVDTARHSHTRPTHR
ncbi:hypothetical protein ACET3X_007432 [Alternaria dauci]|uniref:Uncharacterized protein n=1 Tax=Alternaria dauci TaxID=48095 RepID=A0ABR3UBY4_9PLEO